MSKSSSILRGERVVLLSKMILIFESLGFISLVIFSACPNGGCQDYSVFSAFIFGGGLLLGWLLSLGIFFESIKNGEISNVWSVAFQLVIGNVFMGLMVCVMYAGNMRSPPFFHESIWSNSFYK